MTNPAPLDDDLFGLGDDVEFIEDREYGSVYPVLSYIVGDVKHANKKSIFYTGGFFIDLQAAPDVDVLKSLGFVEETRVTSEGEEIPGLAIRDLEGFINNSRRAWTVELPDGSLTKLYAQSEYDDAKEVGSPRGLCHTLMTLKGAIDLGPFMLSFRGMVASDVAGQNGIISSHGQKIVMAARNLSARRGRRKKFPACLFSLKIGPARDEKNKPIYDTVGKGNATSKIVHPVWLDKPEGRASEADVRSRFCGKDDLAVLQGYVTDSEAWRGTYSEENLRARRGEAPAGALPTGGAGGTGDGLPKGNEVGF